MSRGRYGNVKKPVYDGHRFDSKREFERYLVLKMMEKAGEIKDLELQPRFPIEFGDVKVMMSSNQHGKRDRQLEYIGDFRYVDIDKKHGTTLRIIEDVKMQSGHKETSYKIKRALMEAMGYEIREV